jgi:hypothetical protein
MPENKTKATEESVESHINSIVDPIRRRDCADLAILMAEATKEPPKMWGTSIVGFGSYHYRYESGREGDTCLVGFASRKGDISIYGLNAAPRHAELIPRLGKHKAGKGCLYIRNLADVDLKVLQILVADAAKVKHHANP